MYASNQSNMPHQDVAPAAEREPTSTWLVMLGTNIYGILRSLPGEHDDISLITGKLKSELAIYEQDGVFSDDAFLASDYCQEIEREIRAQGKTPLTPYECVLAKELRGEGFPTGATLLIIMQMRHRKSISDSGSPLPEKVERILRTQ